MGTIERTLLDAARVLTRDVSRLDFAAPVAYVYNPLDYAFNTYSKYVRRFGTARKEVVLVGMNPGPFGMVQTGVPFGEVAAVRDWMGIHAKVRPPVSAHPKRPVDGFSCRRSEVSGKRLWGWAAARSGSADAFFTGWFVINYCPLAFVAESGRNLTPDQLPVEVRRVLYAACDRHLARALAALAPAWVIGIGDFAEKRIRAVVESDAGRATLGRQIRIGRILHPSPASPPANRGWAEAVERELAQQGVPIPGEPVTTNVGSLSEARR